ncbi:MAG: hypothetical protein M9916_05035 [Crocinitomicaceae bacterium]|nr:hypothetical protein [Crocinitomicaceae bacterium]
MTIDEAKLFFPFEEGDDLEELYDERFFEYKNFFLSKIPIKKVVESKLNRLVQLDKAYRFLQQELNNVRIPEPSIDWSEVNKAIEFPNNVLKAFNQWEELKGKCKQQIAVATAIENLFKAVNEFVAVTNSYRAKWVTEQEIDIEVSQLSKEEDAMQVYAEIKQFNEKGGTTFDDILLVNDNLFLLKEMKRLSLLAKNYSSGSI